MRPLLLAVVLTSAAAPAAQAAGVQTLSRGLSGYAQAAALATDDAGTTAVAYQTRRGIEVRVARGGGPFGRAVVAASRARGGRVDATLRLAVGGGRVLVAWSRADGSFPGDPDNRDDPCCSRIHAVVIGAGGRPGRPRRLSRPGVDMDVGPLAVTARTAAVTWQPFYGGTWRVRVLRGRRWARSRRILTGSAGDVRPVGGRLMAVGAAQAGRRVRVLRRFIGRSGRLSRRVTVAAFRDELGEADLRIDAMGRTTGFVSTYSEGFHDRLIARGRAPELGLRQRESVVLGHAGSGAAAIVVSRRTTARVRVRPGARAAFGPWLRFRIAPKAGYVMEHQVRAATRADGVTSILSLPGPSQKRLLMRRLDADGGAGPLRRLRTYRRGAELAGAAYDATGALVVLVIVQRRLEVVRV